MSFTVYKARASRATSGVAVCGHDGPIKKCRVAMQLTDHPRPQWFLSAATASDRCGRGSAKLGNEQHESQKRRRRTDTV